MSNDASGGRRLGRGLKALISIAETELSGGELLRIPIGRIRPNPFQPRRDFNPEELADLEGSLTASGLLQPITVRKVGDGFELIAGERRLRAATNIGWTEIPALVKDADDQTSLVLALVENLQRSDLNPIDEARGYYRLTEEFGLTQQQIADATSKDRTTVANLLRLLSLPDSVQRLVADGRLSAGHAKAIASLPGPAASALANEIVALGLSVRATEERARAAAGAGGAKKTAPKSGTGPTRQTDPAVAAVENDLRRYLQTDVHLQVGTSGAGSLRIGFYSRDDLQRLLDLIQRQHQDT